MPDHDNTHRGLFGLRGCIALFIVAFLAIAAAIISDISRDFPRVTQPTNPATP